MEVGDSVFLEVEESEPLNKLSGKIANSARYYGYKTDKKFKTVIDRENNGVRTWRIE